MRPCSKQASMQASRVRDIHHVVTQVEECVLLAAGGQFADDVGRPLFFDRRRPISLGCFRCPAVVGSELTLLCIPKKEEALNSACIAAGLERLLANEMLQPGKRALSVTEVPWWQPVGQWARRVGERGLLVLVVPRTGVGSSIGQPRLGVLGSRGRVEMLVSFSA